MISAEEKRERGFADDEELVMPLPVDDDESDDECVSPRPGDADEPASGGAQMEALLERVVDGDTTAAPRLFDADMWRELAVGTGLHVCEGSAAAAATSTNDATRLRRSLDERGYLQSEPLAGSSDELDALRRLKLMLDELRVRGFAPAWIYVFDEAWEVLERCWRLLAEVLAPGEPPDAIVLEPSFFAYALVRPAEAAALEDAADAREVVRHTYVGGNFGLPHRDHSSADCFDGVSGAPTMVSLWCPLTPVTADNGCMHVVPKEFDPLLTQPDHPLHLLPFDQHSRRANFELSAAVALAPCEPSCAVAWHGSSIHWGGRCSRYAAAEPRASLTATLRRRDAPRTQLQRLQRLPELSLSTSPSLFSTSLPLPLADRVRYVAANILLYKYWYGLAQGVIPPQLVGAAAE